MCMKTAVIYCRVSTEAQDSNYSLGSQQKSCEEWADTNEYKIVEVISEDYTGRVMNRPGLSRALTLIEESRINALIVHSLDRLARNQAQRAILRDELLQAGVELIYATRGKFVDNPANRFVDNVEGAVAEYEIELIKERMERGRKEKASRGKIIGSGLPPFGYDHADGKFIVNEEEAESVREIFLLYTSGNSITTIAQIFTDRRVPTKCDRNWSKEKRSGYGKWYHEVIYRILRNRTYTGEYWFMKKKIKIGVPLIIDLETFENAQRKLSRSKRDSGVTRAKAKLLLTGHVRCECGYTATLANSGKNGYHYYRCTAKDGRNTVYCCTNPHHKAETINNLTWNWIIERLSNPRIITEEVEKQNANLENAASIKKKQIESLEKQIADIDNQIDQLIDLFSIRRIDKERLEIKIEELESRKKKTKKERDSIQTPKRHEVNIDAIEELSKIINQRAISLTFEEKLAITRELNVEATVGAINGKRTLTINSLVGSNTWIY
jgi:site-specific DNA recombinase